jgi:hypothetical protein
MYLLVRQSLDGIASALVSDEPQTQHRPHNPGMHSYVVVICGDKTRGMKEEDGQSTRGF